MIADSREPVPRVAEGEHCPDFPEQRSPSKESSKESSLKKCAGSNFKKKKDKDLSGSKKTDSTFVMDVSAGVVGWIIGRSGSRIKDIQQATDCKIWVDQDVPNDQPRKVFFLGTKRSIASATARVRELVESAPPVPSSPAQTQARAAAAASACAAPPSPTQAQAQQESSVVDCPASLVGLLIGRRGSTVKHIQSLSGAQVSINNHNCREGLPRKVVVSGSTECIARALALIDEVLRCKSLQGEMCLGADDGSGAAGPPLSRGGGDADAASSNGRSPMGDRWPSSGSQAYPEAWSAPGEEYLAFGYSSTDGSIESSSFAAAASPSAHSARNSLLSTLGCGESLSALMSDTSLCSTWSPSAAKKTGQYSVPYCDQQSPQRPNPLMLGDAFCEYNDSAHQNMEKEGAGISSPSGLKGILSSPHDALAKMSQIELAMDSSEPVSYVPLPSLKQNDSHFEHALDSSTKVDVDERAFSFDMFLK
jgi:hypothetical protein